MNDAQQQAAEQPLVLKFGGSLVEQLGAQLYPSVTATVAELISNAWDADAENVWVTIPFDDWSTEATIEVLDDGHGMTREEAQYRYLIVGRNRRREHPGEQSEGGRRLHGRKGIGKLAAFGTAGWLECVTFNGAELTAFAIDYQSLRTHEPTKDYETETVENPEPLLDPESGEPLAHGTRVRLTQLRPKRRPSETKFRRSMARRFSISANDMSVLINGDPLTRFEHEVEIRFPRDARPPWADIEIDDDGWACEEIDYNGSKVPVRWWIGFTKTPISEEDMRGISILARGKQAQRPFTFESAQGTEGQLGQEYVVGEVEADWLDRGIEPDDDLIQSNRDQLQLDNEELAPFLEWGRSLLRWALAERNRLRRERRVGPGAFTAGVEELIDSTPAPTQRRLRTLAGRLSAMTDERGLETAMGAIVNSSDAVLTKDVARALSLDGDPDSKETWELISSSETTAREVLVGQVDSRIAAMERFTIAVGEPPVLGLHQHVFDAPWLIAPWLELSARALIRSDENVCVVDFEPVPELSPGLRICAFRPGDQFKLEDYIDAVETRNNSPSLRLVIDTIPPPEVEAESFNAVGWAETLRQSIEIHQVWRRALAGSAS
jgi:hypothetical protein